MDQDDEFRDDLIAVVNAMEEIGLEEVDALADLYFERKHRPLNRKPAQVRHRRPIALPTVLGVVGAPCATAAAVLTIWLIPGMAYERANQVYLVPSALSHLYYIALVVTLTVTVVCVRAERKRRRA